MKNFVIYQGKMIAKGSEAYKLWEEKRWKELVALQARLRQEAIKRGEIPQTNPNQETNNV